MKDNFDVYNWKQGNNTKTSTSGEFDLHEWNKNRYLNESKDYLENLVLNLTQAHPDLRFEVSNFDDVRVYGSQQDLLTFGNKMHGEKFGEYEVFHVDDDDRGEIVRIVKSDSIMKNFENVTQEGTCGYNEDATTGKKLKTPGGLKETIQFIKENNPNFTIEEITTELKEIKELGKQLNEKLCKKGEAYRKRRMAAGEKSSAYLSGRAVKVCKGQMSGKKKKK